MLIVVVLASTSAVHIGDILITTSSRLYRRADLLSVPARKGVLLYKETQPLLRECFDHTPDAAVDRVEIAGGVATLY